MKAETTSGTVNAPGAVDADFNIFEAAFSPEIEQFARNPFRSSVGSRTSIAGVRTGTVTFTTELVGSGTAGTAPSIGKLLEPCGFEEITSVAEITGTFSGTFQVGESVSQSTGMSDATVLAVTDSALYVHNLTGTPGGLTVTGGTSSATVSSPTITVDAGVAYKSRTAPSAYSSSDVPTVTVDMLNDGLRHRLIGARGSVSFTASTGQPMQAQFTFQGPKAATADATLLSSISYPGVPPTLLAAEFKVQDFAGIIDNIEINANNELAVRRDANKASGVIATEIVSRNVTGSIDPEATLISGGHDWYNKLETNTTGQLQVTVGAGAGGAGNKFILIGAQTQYTGISTSDRNGIAVNNVDLALTETSVGDDDLVILCL